MCCVNIIPRIIRGGKVRRDEMAISGAVGKVIIGLLVAKSVVGAAVIGGALLYRAANKPK